MQQKKYPRNACICTNDHKRKLQMQAQACMDHKINTYKVMNTHFPYQATLSNSYQLRLSLLMCHEDDAIMHEVAICMSHRQVHYATKCITASSECATSHKLSWACHNCFIAGHGTLPFYRCGLISKSAITTYCTLKCALSDLMHCFLKHLDVM